MQKAKLMRRLWAGVGLVIFSSTSTPVALGLAGLGAIATFPHSAKAATLTNWQFDPTTRQLVVTVPQGTTPRYFLLAQPARIVVDLPNTRVGEVPEMRSYSGAVRTIRVAQFQPDLARIVIELAPDAVLSAEQVELRQADAADGQRNRWIVRPLLATDAPVASAPAQPSASPNPSAQPPAATGATTPPSDASTAPDAEPADGFSDLPALEPNVVEPSAVGQLNPPDSPPGSPSASSPLPPLEPGATEIPVEPSPSAIAPEPEPQRSPALPPLEPNATEIPIDRPSDDVAEVSPPPSPELPTPNNSAEPDLAQAEATQAAAENPPADEPAVADPVEQADADAPAISAERSEPARPASDADARPATQQPPAIDEPAEAIAPPEPDAVAPQSESRPRAVPVTPAPVPAALPPATFQPDRPVTVSVPPLNRENGSSSSQQPAPATPSALPPAAFTPPPEGQVSVPPLQSSTPQQPAARLPVAPTEVSRPAPGAAAPTTVEFGQPLPHPSVTTNLPAVEPGQVAPPSTPQAIAVAPTTSILIPAGTSLNLRYPGESVLELAAGLPRQEVLVLEQAIVDSVGNLIAPAGSEVVGRFETGRDGSQFVAQAISIRGQNLLIEAKSGMLSGDRQVSDNQLFRNSALGALALTILGGFTGVGLLGGAAAGVATTYLTSPQPAIIQPNQIIEVRLTDDVPIQ